MNPARPDPAAARLKRAAAEWLTKHDRGLTPAEQDDFLQWLAADPRHGAWFARHRAGWRRLDAIAAWRPEHGNEPNPDVLARFPHRRNWPRAAGLTALAAALVVAAAFLWPESRQPDLPLPGGYERRMLDDGSMAELNRGAEIEVNFTATERRVVLRQGEALFTVAPNPQRPFVVRTRGVAVRAVGTAFNVRLADTGVEVLVTEGKVQLAPPAGDRSANPPASAAGAPLVAAGERALVPFAANTTPQIARTTDAELARLRAWQPQLLDFSSTPLAQVIAALNRRNRVQLVLADPASANVPIIASIRSDNIDGFVSLVTLATGLRAEHRGDYEIVLRAGDASGGAR
jgi:transmembrane sensor